MCAINNRQSNGWRGWAAGEAARVAVAVAALEVEAA